MSELITVKVPDIGNYKDIPVIDVCVKAGDTVKAEDALLTVESEKATMDIPSPVAGVVKEIKVKVGDRVSEGHAVAVIEASSTSSATSPAPSSSSANPTLASSASSSTAPAPTQGPAPSSAATASTYSGTVDMQCEMLVLGGGPGGYSAAFRAADLGLNTIIVERYATLG
ncbi:MAG TPA: FAD-dependent oxidoreductase, partial [Leptospiraceae bacterium]|nr:FAD-dependent oxidoreductase [Leptospiraceae bacterium]